MNSRNKLAIIRCLALVYGYCVRINKEIQQHIDRSREARDIDEKAIEADAKDIELIEELQKIISALKSDSKDHNLNASAAILLEITLRKYSHAFTQVPYARKAKNRILKLLQIIHYKVSCSIE